MRIPPVIIDTIPEKSPCVQVPRVPAFDWGDWETAIESLQTGARLAFGQHWLPEPEAEFQTGSVWMGLLGNNLIIYAKLVDEAPANRATSWNEATWEMGDVFELFFKGRDRKAYYEFHVTPENQRIQLLFPSFDAFYEFRGHQHWAIDESLFDSLTRINVAGQGWEVLMRIPLNRVLNAPREDVSRHFLFSFSRFDYQPGREGAVKSSTSRFTGCPRFHYSPEWTWALAAD